MTSRFISIWFPNLATDHQIRVRPELYGLEFALAAPERGRMVVTAASAEAGALGIETRMVVADARAILPSLVVLDDEPEDAARQRQALRQQMRGVARQVALDPNDGIDL